MFLQKFFLNTTNIRLLPAVMLTVGLLLSIKLVNLVFFPEKYTRTTTPIYAQEATKEKASTNAPDKMEDTLDTQKNDAKKTENNQKDIASNQPQKDTKKIADKENGRVEEDFQYNRKDSILTQLRNRRNTLEKIEKSLTLKKNLIELSEKRLDEKIKQLKELQEIEKQKKIRNELSKEQKLNHVIKMYEGMKPSEAARILNQLEMDVLKKIVTSIKPRNMAKILAKMDVNIAQQLTTELAEINTNAKDGLSKTRNENELPRIGG